MIFGTWTRNVTLTVVLGVLAASAITLWQAGPSYSASGGSTVTARWSGAVRTSDKAAVNSAYWSRYAPGLGTPITWQNGSVGRCLPGDNAAETGRATLRSLNFVRSMAGLAPVGFSATLNARAQRAALIMDANNALSHTPSPDWRCYTRTGAEAASKSNLVISGGNLTPGRIIQDYMDDRGSSNAAVGHRRWLLNPFSTTMGSGSTNAANALVVVGPTNAYRPSPAYIGWPSAGYFPNTMEPDGRWSLSAGRSSTSFRYARVSVYDQSGQRVTLHQYLPHAGYAQPTLAWQLAPGYRNSGMYHVVVQGIRRVGSSRSYSYDYKVRLFEPYR